VVCKGTGDSFQLTARSGRAALGYVHDDEFSAVSRNARVLELQEDGEFELSQLPIGDRLDDYLLRATEGELALFPRDGADEEGALFRDDGDWASELYAGWATVHGAHVDDDAVRHLLVARPNADDDTLHDAVLVTATSPDDTEETDVVTLSDPNSLRLLSDGSAGLSVAYEDAGVRYLWNVDDGALELQSVPAAA
jgi:hypothetical protein